MSEFKVGGLFRVVSDSHKNIGVNVGDTVELVRLCDDNCHAFKHKNVGNTLYYFEGSVSPITNEYEQSNRYKLKQAVVKTGLTAESLSIAMGKAKTYLTGITSNSRFISRGDISDESLNKLITDLAFAERNLLAVKAKIIDESNVSIGDEFRKVSENNTGAEYRSNKEFKEIESYPEFIDNFNISEINTTDFINYYNESPKNHKYILLCITWCIALFTGFIGFLCWLAFK